MKYAQFGNRFNIYLETVCRECVRRVLFLLTNIWISWIEKSPKATNPEWFFVKQSETPECWSSQENDISNIPNTPNWLELLERRSSAFSLLKKDMEWYVLFTKCTSRFWLKKRKKKVIWQGELEYLGRSSKWKCFLDPVVVGQKQLRLWIEQRILLGKRWDTGPKAQFIAPFAGLSATFCSMILEFWVHSNIFDTRSTAKLWNRRKESIESHQGPVVELSLSSSAQKGDRGEYNILRCSNDVSNLICR